MLKKMTLAVIGLAVSGAASAGMYSTPPAPSCTPGDVTVPCEQNLWDLGVQALYLKPISDRNYRFIPSGPVATVGSVREVEADWGWGYRLEGSYHYSTGSDITANWLHYDVESNLPGYRGSFISIFSNPPLVVSDYRLFLENKFDQVNLVMGQHVDMGLLKDARFYGGFQYANIRVNGTNYYNPTRAVAVATNGVRDLNRTDYNGVGPTIGIDYAYALTQGLSVTANTSTSILYGTGRINQGTTYGSGLVLTNFYASKKLVVPSFEAKLGANYAYPLWEGVLNLQGGYQVVNYFDALQNIQVSVTNVASGVVTSRDFGLYGPYFGLKWIGNA